jgi:hypothetical protein
MSSDVDLALSAIKQLAPVLRATGGVLSGEAAAHVHIAAATGAVPGAGARYSALAPLSIEAIWPEPVAQHSNVPTGVVRGSGSVAGVVSGQLPLFSTMATWSDGTVLPVLRREAVLAELLERGGLAIGLAGTVLRLANDPPIDPDEVRELLKAARRPERFQPLLELLNVA